MSVYTNEIGTYIDPSLISPFNIEEGPFQPSYKGGFDGLNRVELPDGRTALVNSDGIIIGYE